MIMEWKEKINPVGSEILGCKLTKKQIKRYTKKMKKYFNKCIEFKRGDMNEALKLFNSTFREHLSKIIFLDNISITRIASRVYQLKEIPLYNVTNNNLKIPAIPHLRYLSLFEYDPFIDYIRSSDIIFEQISDYTIAYNYMQMSDTKFLGGEKRGFYREYNRKFLVIGIFSENLALFHIMGRVIESLAYTKKELEHQSELLGIDAEKFIDIIPVTNKEGYYKLANNVTSDILPYHESPSYINAVIDNCAAIIRMLEYFDDTTLLASYPVLSIGIKALEIFANFGKVPMDDKFVDWITKLDIRYTNIGDLISLSYSAAEIGHYGVYFIYDYSYHRALAYTGREVKDSDKSTLKSTTYNTHILFRFSTLLSIITNPKALTEYSKFGITDEELGLMKN